MSNEIPQSGWGERVRQARLHVGLSIEEAAEQVGVARRSWTNYEGGKSTPNAAVNLMIATRLGVDPGWLLTGALPVDPAWESEARELLGTIIWSHTDPETFVIHDAAGLFDQLIAWGRMQRGS